MKRTDLPAISTRRIACGIEKPSYTGTACVTPSPQSNTIPVVRPEEYLESGCHVGNMRGAPKLCGLQCQYCLYAHEHCWNVERFKEDLSCYITILPWI